MQTTLALGNIAIDRRSPDYMAMVVMNHVIGGGASSRLFLNLREEKGYTYGVYSDFSAVRYPGPWRAGGNMRTEVLRALRSNFLTNPAHPGTPGPTRRIRGEPARDRRGLRASLEQPARALGFAMACKLYGLPADYWDGYAARSRR